MSEQNTVSNQERIAIALEQIAAIQTQLLAIAMESRKTRIDMQTKMTDMLKRPPMEKE